MNQMKIISDNFSKNDRKAVRINLQQYLVGISNGEKIYFIPNRGNAGDSIIAAATYLLFDKLEIDYETVNLSTFNSNNKIVIYGGGGNLTNYYSNARNFIYKFHKKSKKMIILPHTISGNEELLEVLGENSEIIVREKISFDHVLKHNHRSKVYLADDIALSINVKDIKKVSLIQILQKKEVINKLLRSSLVELKHNFIRIVFKQKVLNCLRIDREKTNIKIPIINIDISEVFAFGTSNKELCFYGSYRLIKFLSKYTKIRTNRLHICIIAALLKKEVEFHSNSYYKCEAVYEFSMKDFFKNIKWMEQ